MSRWFSVSVLFWDIFRIFMANWSKTKPNIKQKKKGFYVVIDFAEYIVWIYSLDM